MATVEHGTREIYTAAPVDATAAMRRPIFSAVRWGAIFAGVAAGISVQLVLTLLGIATGLSATNVAQSDTASPMSAMLWAGASMLISAFIGGYVAARMSGLKRKADGVLHGLVSWAVTTLLFATIAASAGGSMLGGIFNTVGSGVMQQASQSGGQGNSMLSKILGPQASRMDAQTMQTFQGYIRNGQRDQAIQLLTSSAGMQQSRAASVVDQALIVSGSPENASPQARNTANQAVEKAGTTAWVLFAAVALALAIGIAGGVVGAVGSRRTTWASGAVPRTA